ncbi:MAG: DUF2934 domain-containing protein [Candidatus Omnitrophota bacterium]
MKVRCKKIDLTDYIKIKAKELWEKDGCKQGRDLDYWLKAEKITKSQMKKEYPDCIF